MLFAALTHLAEGQCLNALLTLKFLSYLPCRHTNTISVHDGMANYFALKIINKKYSIEMSSSGIKCFKNYTI
jgi:hypothetical protein